MKANNTKKRTKTTKSNPKSIRQILAIAAVISSIIRLISLYVPSFRTIFQENPLILSILSPWIFIFLTVAITIDHKRKYSEYNPSRTLNALQNDWIPALTSIARLALESGLILFSLTVLFYFEVRLDASLIYSNIPTIAFINRIYAVTLLIITTTYAIVLHK